MNVTSADGRKMNVNLNARATGRGQQCCGTFLAISLSLVESCSAKFILFLWLIVFPELLVYKKIILGTSIMDILDSAESSDEVGKVPTKLTKKRKPTGRMNEVMKKLRLSSHEPGPDCKCSRLKCFQTVSEFARMKLIKEFNEIKSYDEQSSFLSGLITVLPVRKRKSMEGSSREKKASYAFRVRVDVDGTNRDLPVCFKAFKSIFGITPKRVQTIQQSLTKKGCSPKDNRGKHANRPHKITDQTRDLVKNFINSLKGRKSHYSLNDSDKIYLPEDLNLSKLTKMYNEIHKENIVHYDTFRSIFNNEFNISFGYPRKDTCSMCDAIRSQKSAIESGTATTLPDSQKIFDPKIEIQKLETEHKLHLSKAEKFYSIKRNFKKISKRNHAVAAIAMDFQKNLPTPNITTNDVYYKRQLNFYSFNIHVLSTGDAAFYTYDESVARKGSDDVCSMLDNYVTNFLSEEVRNLVIFCDSCAGQNKNYTLIRYLHHLVTEKHRFDSVEVYFPIRGHSYLECDKNMSYINQQTYVELPDEWRDVIRNSRERPSPFAVINCQQELFKTWTEFLTPMYLKNCPFPTRPVRCLKVMNEHPSKIFHRNTFSGCYMNAEILWKPPKRGKNARKRPAPRRPLTNLYDGPLPISQPKFNDLQQLKRFLVNPAAKAFFENLPTINPAAVHDDSEDVYLDYPDE